MKNSRYYPCERNRYFYGKLLTVRDFESEQKYFNDKRRLINKLLHGSGVVCGLQVVAVDEKTISVETGMALDYSGREIVVASPVTQKLSMIDGFSDNDYAKDIYLCIAYDEKGKEPVHSIAGSQSDDVSEYNRIQESYRLFIKEEAPEPSGFGFTRLFEDVSLIYLDNQIKIWQKVPRYVNPEGSFELLVRIEKSVQASRIELEYEIESEHFQDTEGNSDIKISFAEPENSMETDYELRYILNAGNYPDTMGKISVKDKQIKLKIGDQVLDTISDCTNTVQIIEESIKDKILKTYLNLSLDQYIESTSAQCIYLAKISLLQIGPTYMIEKVEQLPFGEYVYNTSSLYALGLLEGRNARGGDLSARATTVILPAEAEPRLDARYNEQKNELNLQLGIPRSEKVNNTLVTTGVTDIETEENPRAGKSYFSDEIEHGLGPGPVFIIAGVEESSEEEVMDIPHHSEQIFFGAYEVFHKSPYDSLGPRVAIGTVVYPQKGTFRIGIKSQRSKLAKVRLRWWAYKKED